MQYARSQQIPSGTDLSARGMVNHEHARAHSNASRLRVRGAGPNISYLTKTPKL